MGRRFSSSSNVSSSWLGTHAPVRGYDDCEKNNESERVKQHGRRACLRKNRCGWPALSPDNFPVQSQARATNKIDQVIQSRGLKIKKAFSALRALNRFNA